MTYQAIGLGTTVGDGTGDSIRDGGDKINDNFVEIYTLLGTGTALSSGISATATVVTLAGPSISGVASFADGSVSAPSITNTGDADTGIYFSAANTVAVTTGGTLRASVTSAGLDVVADVTAANFQPDGDTSTGDAAAFGYTSVLGAIITGQGSTNDVTIVNDADTTVMGVATGTTTVNFAGQVTGTGFTGTLDGILGSGTPAAATVTQLTSGGVIVSDTDSTDDLGTTGVRWRALYVDAITATDQITATGFTGTLDGILGSGAAAAATVTTLTASGIVSVDDATQSTSTTTGSIHTDGGLGVVKDVFIGGSLSVGGAEAKVSGKETIWVPAAAMYPSTTNPCSNLAQVETTALRPDIKVLDFATGADEFAQFAIAFPKSWNEGTVSFQPYWTVTGTNTGTVAWQLGGIAVSSDDTINTAFGTLVATTALAHSGTSNDLMVSVESGAVTIAGSPAAADQCFFQVNRDVSADSQTGDARLLGIKLLFTTDAANDA